MKRFELIDNGVWYKYDLKITLKPCYRCNQCCWYCHEFDNKTNMWSLEQCDEVLDKLSRIPTSREDIFIYMYGGEPTMSDYWEYLQLELSNLLSDRNVVFQTQTNMSVSAYRLRNFLSDARANMPDNHVIDICSSYHLYKQSVDEFISKMRICDEYDSLGFCFFSTEIDKEEQMISDFNSLIAVYPDKVKMKFTVVGDVRTNRRYKHLLKDDYLMGTDDGEYIEYRYYTRKYPHMKQYLEHSWNFDVDGVNKNYVDVVHDRDYARVKYMRCEAGSKGIVIDHDLLVYHCNDDFESKIKQTSLQDFEVADYIKTDTVCLNCSCWDGLDFKKYRQ